MIPRLSYVLFLTHLQSALSSPVRRERSPLDLQTRPTYIYSHQIPVLQNVIYQKPTLLTPINLVYHNLHVLPIHHKDIPVFSHPVSQNVTQNVIPVLISDVSVHLGDLTVIPLRQQQMGRYRATETKQEEPVNQFRNFYGGYGTILFGGHGAGHGFYSYGK